MARLKPQHSGHKTQLRTTQAKKKTPRYGRVPARVSSPSTNNTALWVIIGVVIVVITIIVLAYNHNKSQEEAIHTVLKQNAEQHEAAKTHNEKIQQQIAEEKRREAEVIAQQQAKKELLRKQREAEQQLRAQKEKEQAEQQQSKQEAPAPTPDTEEEESNDSPSTDTPPNTETEEDHTIHLNGKVSEEHLERFKAMVTETVQNKQFDTLRNNLGEILQSSFPEADAGKDNSWHNAQIKGNAAKRAIAMYRALHLAELSDRNASGDKENAFLTWLITDKSFPAGDFVNSIDRHKVSLTDATDMMGELRRFYAEDPKHAGKEIRYITNPEAGGLSKKLYPVSKKDQQEKLKKILATKAPRGVPAAQQDGVNTANAYRYLCGCEPYMVFDKTFHKEAQQAAETCRKAGRIAHDLGGHTDQCNLFAGLSDPVRCVKGYIEDPGGPNRENRGHRAWILDPGATKTAFGIDGSYGAMRVMDSSGNTFPKNGHSYPGKGFFPAAYLHGNGWSFYPPKGSPPADDSLKVEMWKLAHSAKTSPKGAQLSPGRAIPIKAVFKSAFAGSIVFEPDYGKMRSKDGHPVGAYWIRISWKGFKTEYVVDLY